MGESPSVRLAERFHLNISIGENGGAGAMRMVAEGGRRLHYIVEACLSSFLFLYPQGKVGVEAAEE